KFLEKETDATGIIFGGVLTGIGFFQYMKKIRPERLENLKGVCFDALSLTPVLTPELVSIDQNLHLLSYRAVNCLERLMTRDQPIKDVMVEPKMTKATGEGADKFDPFIATCGDYSELHNPHYMKALIANLYEWPREIAQSNLDQI